jgi:hypothetical protein
VDARHKAGHDDFRYKMQKLPVGQITDSLSSPPSQKNFVLRLTQITFTSTTVPSPEGRLAIVTNAGRDAVDVAASGAKVIAGRVSRERLAGAQTNGA